MKKLVTLVRNDMRQIFRDRTLILFLFAPLLLILFIRFFVPFITKLYPVVTGYHDIIMMFGSIQTAIMFGFITSFMILEEKDENVLQVIRVLPVSPLYYILYKLLFATFFSFLGSFLVITFGGIAYPGLGGSLLVSLQAGLAAPFITLVVGTFAKNKVEGMAYFKGIDLVLNIPLLALFTTGAIGFIAAVLPTYWTFRLYRGLLAQENVVFLFAGGTMVYLAVIAMLFFRFRKRVFDR